MGLRTRLTEALGITVPILSAPIGFVAGGKLAAAVTAAGGLGIYGDADWLDREFDAADVLPKTDYPVRASEKQPRPRPLKISFGQPQTYRCKRSLWSPMSRDSLRTHHAPLL
jgi:nitronate monooxygenase